MLYIYYIIISYINFNLIQHLIAVGHPIGVMILVSPINLKCLLFIYLHCIIN